VPDAADRELRDIAERDPADRSLTSTEQPRRPVREVEASAGLSHISMNTLGRRIV